jgi:chromosome partitioning protein
VSTGPHRIVFANEKGGTGKSTTAVHVAVALAYQGVRVAAIDLDNRQATLHRYLENRDETARRRQIPLPNATHAVFREDSTGRSTPSSPIFAQDHDFLIFDTPGATIRWPAMSPPGPTRWSPRSTTVSSIST